MLFDFSVVDFFLATDEEEIAKTIGLAAHYKTGAGLHQRSFESIVGIAIIEETNVTIVGRVETIFDGDVVDERLRCFRGVGTRRNFTSDHKTDANH